MILSVYYQGEEFIFPPNTKVKLRRYCATFPDILRSAAPQRGFFLKMTNTTPLLHSPNHGVSELSQLTASSAFFFFSARGIRRFRSNFCAARRLTFAEMMSVTQLTCVSLLSQQKCLWRESRVTTLIDFRPFDPGDWLLGVTRLDMVCSEGGNFSDYCK